MTARIFYRQNSCGKFTGKRVRSGRLPPTAHSDTAYGKIETVFIWKVDFPNVWVCGKSRGSRWWARWCVLDWDFDGFLIELRLRNDVMSNFYLFNFYAFLFIFKFNLDYKNFSSTTAKWKTFQLLTENYRGYFKGIALIRKISGF